MSEMVRKIEINALQLIGIFNTRVFGATLFQINPKCELAFFVWEAGPEDLLIKTQINKGQVGNKFVFFALELLEKAYHE